MIGAIIIQLNSTGKPFDKADTVLSLCLKSDKELKQAAKLCGAIR